MKKMGEREGGGMRRMKQMGERGREGVGGG